MVCDIGKILELFLYIVGTSLPCYLFFIVMYFILKRTSPNGDISKRFYNNTSSQWEEKIFNIVDIYMNLIHKNIAFIIVNIFLALILILIIIGIRYEPLITYIISDAALRFQKYLIESLLTIIIAVIGSVAIFSSLNKNYYVLFASKDIINIFKIKENIISIFIHYISCTLSVIIYYFCNYLIEDAEKTVLIKLCFFASSSVFALTTLYYTGRLLISIMTFLLSDKAEHKSLNLLYKNIYNKNTPNINIQEVSEMDSSINYLLSNLNVLRMSNEKISFISFSKEFNNFPKEIKNKNLRKTTAAIIMFNLIIAVMIRSLFSQNGHNFIEMAFGTEIGLSVIFSIFFNIVVCFILYKTRLNQIFIHLNMWAWGFKIENGNEKYYSSVCRNSITKKEYDNYFKMLYNILCAFKDILSTNEKSSEYCLHKIINGINRGYGDYLLYIIILFLYSQEYQLSSNEAFALKQYIKNNNIDWQIAIHNANAIVEDIERKNMTNEVDAFMERIKNSKQRVKVKNIR